MKNLFKRFTIMSMFIFPYLPASAQDVPSKAGVVVFDKSAPLPPGAKKIASVKMGDGWRFDCGYDRTLELVKVKAREEGGNAIKVTQVKAPDLWSTCYRIKADVYSISEQEMNAVNGEKERYEDSLTRALVPDTAKYALLYIYRPRSSYGVAVQYNVHIDDEKVCRIRYADKHVIKLHKEGYARIWARTEAREELGLDVKFGNVYFVRCGVKMGAMVGHPDMELTSITQGIDEFEKIDIRTREETSDDVYGRDH